MPQASNYQIKLIEQGLIDWTQVFQSVEAGTIIEIERFLFVNGNNDVSGKTGAIGCLVIPNSDNAIGFNVRQNSTEVGIPYHKTNPFLITFNSVTPAAIAKNWSISFAGSPTGYFQLIWF